MKFSTLTSVSGTVKISSLTVSVSLSFSFVTGMLSIGDSEGSFGITLCFFAGGVFSIFERQKGQHLTIFGFLKAFAHVGLEHTYLIEVDFFLLPTALSVRTDQT